MRKKENEKQNILIGQQNALIGQLIQVNKGKPKDTEESFGPKAIEGDFCENYQVSRKPSFYFNFYILNHV